MSQPESCDRHQPHQLDGEYFLTNAQRRSLESHLQDDLAGLMRQRIQIMLMADRGKSIGEICKELGCALVTADYWSSVARSGSIEQLQLKPIGRPRKIDGEYIHRLKELLNSNPRDYGYSFGRWTVDWLSRHLARELGVVVSIRNLQRILKELGLSTRNKSTAFTQQPRQKKGISIEDLAISKTVGNNFSLDRQFLSHHDSESFVSVYFSDSSCPNLRESNVLSGMGRLY